MTCPDLKAYLLGEEAHSPDMEQHLNGCPACREELERLRMTQTALLTLREEEIPRRIAFVSDKVFEPRWWQRIPRFTAAAAMLSAAIVFHAFYVPAADNAAIEKIVAQRVAKVEQRLVARDEETRAAVNASYEYLLKKMAADRVLNASFVQGGR